MPSLVDTGAYLDQLYQQKFGRVPDAEGKAYWKAELESGKISPEKVSQIFDNTDEAKQVKASREQEARDFLEKTYTEELGREPDAEGAEYWANEINSGRQTQEEVVNNIRQSEEYQEKQEPEEEDWQQEYDNQLNQATNDLTRTDISRGNTTGEEVASGQENRETDLKTAADPEESVQSQAERKQSDAEATAFLNQAYREELGRNPDEEGLQYWKDQITSGNQTQEDVLANIRRSDEYQENQQDEVQEEGRAPDVDNADDFTFGGEEEFNNLYNDTFTAATGGNTTNDLSRNDISQQREQTVAGEEEGITDQTDAEATAFLNQAYREELGRNPDEEGLQYWKDQITSGNQTQEDVLANIRRSDEYQENQQDTDNSDPDLPSTDSEQGKRLAINDIYRDVLERNTDQGGEDYWYEELESGRQTLDDIRSNIERSDEAADLESNKAFIEEQYEGGLDRGSDAGGMSYWLKDLATGQSREDVAANIRRSDEFSTQAENYLDNLYENILERDPDDEGLEYWKEQLTSGNQTRQEVEANINRSDEKWLGDTYKEELGRSLRDEGREYWLNDIKEGQTREQVLANIRRSDEYLNRGEQECPTGQHLENGVCVNDAVTECPEGQRVENGRCVSDVRECPEGTAWDGTQCKATGDVAEECPEGKMRMAGSNECVDIISNCPTGTTRDSTGACVPDEHGDPGQCPTGTYRNEDGNCVGFGICPDGSSTRDHEGGICPDVEEEEECPAGQTRNANGVCEPEDTDDDLTGPCPEGQTRNANGVCEPEDTDDDFTGPCPDGYTRNESGACVEDPGTWTGEDPTDTGEEEDENDIGNYMGEDPSDSGEEEDENDIGNYMGTDPTEDADPGSNAENEGEGTYMGSDPQEEIKETEDETKDPLDTTEALGTTTVLSGGLPRGGANPGERTARGGYQNNGRATGVNTEVKGDMGYRQTRNEYRDLYNAAMRDMASLNDQGEENRVRYGELESRYGKLRADYESARREADSYRDSQRADETSRLRSGITVGGAPGSRRNSLRSGNTATSDRSRRRGVSARSNRGRDRSSSMQGIRSGF